MLCGFAMPNLLVLLIWEHSWPLKSVARKDVRFFSFCELSSSSGNLPSWVLDGLEKDSPMRFVGHWASGGAGVVCFNLDARRLDLWGVHIGDLRTSVLGLRHQIVCRPSLNLIALRPLIGLGYAEANDHNKLTFLSVHDAGCFSGSEVPSSAVVSSFERFKVEMRRFMKSENINRNMNRKRLFSWK